MSIWGGIILKKDFKKEKRKVNKKQKKKRKHAFDHKKGKDLEKSKIQKKKKDKTQFGYWEKKREDQETKTSNAANHLFQALMALSSVSSWTDEADPASFKVTRSIRSLKG